MKRVTVFATMTLFVVGLAVGMLLTAVQDAQAIDLCTYECTFRTDWTSHTGSPCGADECQIIRRSTCTGGPLNCEYIYEVIGCDIGCNGGFPAYLLKRF